MKKLRSILIVFMTVLVFVASVGQASATGSAGLYRQYNFGIYKLDIINLHTGYAGPSAGSTVHSNVRLYASSSLTRNYHVAGYSSGANACWSIWDSVQGREWKNCHSTSSAATTALRDRLLALLDEATGNQYRNTLIIIVGIFAIYWNLTKYQLRFV